MLVFVFSTIFNIFNCCISPILLLWWVGKPVRNKARKEDGSVFPLEVTVWHLWSHHCLRWDRSRAGRTGSLWDDTGLRVQECWCVHLLGNAGGRLEKWTHVIRSVDQSAVVGCRSQGCCRGVEGAGRCFCDSRSGVWS